MTTFKSFVDPGDPKAIKAVPNQARRDMFGNLFMVVDFDANYTGGEYHIVKHDPAPDAPACGFGGEVLVIPYDAMRATEYAYGPTESWSGEEQLVARVARTTAKASVKLPAEATCAFLVSISDFARLDVSGVERVYNGLAQFRRNMNRL